MLEQPPLCTTVEAGWILRVGVEPAGFALAEVVFSWAGALLRFRGVTWCRNSRLWGLWRLIWKTWKDNEDPAKVSQKTSNAQAEHTGSHASTRHPSPHRWRTATP